MLERCCPWENLSGFSTVIVSTSVVVVAIEGRLGSRETDTLRARVKRAGSSRCADGLLVREAGDAYTYQIRQRDPSKHFI